MGAREAGGGVERAGCRAGGQHESGAVAAAGGPVGVGGEVCLRLVPGELAAAVRPEVHHRRPAAGHGDRVAGDPLAVGALAGLGADLDAGDAPAACYPGDAAAFDDADAERARPPRAADP